MRQSIARAGEPPATPFEGHAGLLNSEIVSQIVLLSVIGAVLHARFGRGAVVPARAGLPDKRT